MGGAGVLFAAGLYWTWCWGWWGSENLFFSWLLQCQCPRASEEARYPERVDVIVPACDRLELAGISPTGKPLILGNRAELDIWGQPTSILPPPRSDTMFLLDPVTGQKKPLTMGGRFITDSLLLNTEQLVLLDLTDNSRTPIQRVEELPGVWATEGEINWEVAIAPFRRTDRVFLLGEIGLAVGIASDFKQRLDRNYLLGSRLGSEERKRIESLLVDEGIPFQRVEDKCGVYECPSRDGSLDYREAYKEAGIFAVGDNRRIVEAYRRQFAGEIERREFTGRGWIRDDSGVVLVSRGHTTYLIGESGQMFALFPIPQPILKLKVPSEYLSPEAWARDEAHQAQERAAQTWAKVTFWAVLGTVTVAVAAALRHPWRGRDRKAA